ncbi:MAG: CBS domain-containing protein [Steroidobacteraceae bacterium]
MHPTDPVNRFMTEPAVSIELGSPAAEVLRLFSVHPFHHLPVVDRGKVVGMLSSADVLRLEAFLPKRGGTSSDFLNQRLHIAQLMRQPPITVAGNQSVEQATILMTKHGIHALPVIDSNDNLLGIITTTDIISALLHTDQRSSAHGTSTMETESDATPREVSPAQMREAAQLAATAAHLSDDMGKMARALLHAESRLRVLEDVLVSADRYVHAGQDQNLHRLLVKAITKAKESSAGTLRQRL